MFDIEISKYDGIVYERAAASLSIENTDNKNGIS